MGGGQLTVGGATPGLVVLPLSIRKQTEQSIKQPVGGECLHPLSHLTSLKIIPLNAYYELNTYA